MLALTGNGNYIRVLRGMPTNGHCLSAEGVRSEVRSHRPLPPPSTVHRPPSTATNATAAVHRSRRRRHRRCLSQPPSTVHRRRHRSHRHRRRSHNRLTVTTAVSVAATATATAATVVATTIADQCQWTELVRQIAVNLPVKPSNRDLTRRTATLAADGAVFMISLGVGWVSAR